jgi:hypothetical protein
MSTSYTDMRLHELRNAGWDVGLRSINDEHWVAYAKRDGHTCVGEGAGELGALTALSKSISALADEDERGADPT